MTEWSIAIPLHSPDNGGVNRTGEVTTFLPPPYQGKGPSMRRSALLLSSMALGTLLVSGVAWATNEIFCDGGECRGTPRSDRIHGSPERDVIYAFKGPDYMWARGGRDEVYGFDGYDFVTGGTGIDKVSGGNGRDHLLDGPLEEYAQDTVNGGNGSDYSETQNLPAYADIVNCGEGDDTARVDGEDVVNDDCETVQVVDENGGVGGRLPSSATKTAK
jgi:Ca2+-binding RTX toxin-like protein